jgi:hypothetical protein
MDLGDFNFSDVEDFGLAKSFSNAPLGMIAPQFGSELTSSNNIDASEKADCERAMGD